MNPVRSITKGGVACLTVVAMFGLSAQAASAAKAPVYQDGYLCSVVGQHNNATLRGTANAVVCAISGNHTLIAGSGNEVLIGGSGNDHLIASKVTNTRDVLIGGAGTDVLTGGAGVDTLIAGSGNDTLDAGTGTQYLYGGAGADLLVGGSGNDTLIAGSGKNTLKAGTGPTSLVGGTGNDTLVGGKNTSTVLGGRGADNVTLGSSLHTHVALGSGASTLNCGGSSSTTIVTDTRAHVSSSCRSSHDASVSDQSYWGQVTAVNGLQVTVQYSGDNSVAQSWLAANGSPTSVTFDFTDATIQSDTGSTTPSVGDFVWVDASTPTTGTLLPALYVHIHSTQSENEGQLRFEGQITGVNGSQITVQYADVNDTAQAWLDANSDPTTVTFDISNVTITDHGVTVQPAVGDLVSVRALTPAVGATVLTATSVRIHTPRDERSDLQRYVGVVSSVTGSQVTVTYSDENDSAQSWLNTTFGVTLPTTVTVDITNANVEPSGATPAVGATIIFSAQAPSSGTVLVGVDVFLPPTGGRGDGHGGDHRGLQHYAGQVTAVSGSQVTVQYTDNNDAAQTWLNANGDPTTVTFDITNATIQSDTGSNVPAVGNFVQVDASTPTSGTVLPAVAVCIHGQGSQGDGGDGGGSTSGQGDQRYFGQVTAVVGSQVTVQYTDNNDAAQTWLDANGDPTSVTFDISTATISSNDGETTPAVGDFVGVDATTPTSGTVLTAVDVNILGQGGGDQGNPNSYQLYFGQVTGVNGTQVTVQYAANNDVAQTWLDANGDPTSVTFDITNATVTSNDGETTPAVGDWIGVAATTPSSGTVLPAAVVVIGGGSGGGSDHGGGFGGGD